ncbi:MAG: HU family DNA-binding protein [Edaphocola sp.]
MMNKAELIEQIAKDAGLTKVQANDALNSFTNTVVATLKKGDSLTLVGFGTFSVTQRSARNGRNPQTGEVIKIKARKLPKFKAGKDFSTKIAAAKTPKK